MRILGIGGSLRKDSYTNKVLRIAMGKINDPVIETEIVNLQDLNLPFCHGGSNYDDFPDVERFRKKIIEASGIILSSPEYHGSVSGAVKNALDLLDICHVQGKVFALIAVCGGVANTGAVNALRIICRGLHAFVIPEQVIIADAEFAFDASGNLRNSELDVRLNEMVDRLVLFCRQMGKYA